MNNYRFFAQMLALIFFMIFLQKPLFSQKAAAEFITSMPTPSLEEDISIKDGERFVTYRDNYLFSVNFWIGIQIWDVTDIESPKRASFLRTSDMIYHIALDDNRLYAANKTEGVIIFDITNIERPYEIARIKTPGDAYWVDVEYPFIYVALGKEGFCVMDISNLDDPRTLTLEIPETWVWSLQKRDDKLYVAAKQGGLLIYDISNPSNLIKITQYKTGFHALQFQLENDLAYMADGPGGLVILDISAPRLPKEVGRFKTQGFTHHVSKSGNYAYLSNRETGLMIIKVVDPQNPTLEARYISDSETYSSYKEDVYVFLSTDSKIEILRHNNQPILEPIADLSIDENGSFVLQLEAYDPDGDEIYFEVQNLPDSAEFDTKTGLFSWIPTYEQAGVYPGITFTVIEKTASKLSDSDDLTITVNHVNRMPELPAIANVEIPEDSLLVIIAPEGSDPDKEDIGKLIYRVENVPEGTSFDENTRTFRWEPTFKQSGVYIVDFLLEDGAGGVDREAVTLTVTHVDRPPVVETIPDQTTNEAQLITVTLKGEELDQEDLTAITFSMFNLPEGASFDASSRQFSWTPTHEQSGSFENIGVVMKAGNLSDTTYFSLAVAHVNRTPVLTDIQEQSVDENAPLVFFISGSDPDVEDDGKLTYTVTNLPEGATFNPDSLSVKWTPGYIQSGNYPDIQFTVTDPSGLSDQKSISITVSHVNRPPVLAEIPPLTAEENSLLEHQMVGSDPDNEDTGKLLYSASDLPEGAVLAASNGKLIWTPTYEQSGEYQITFTVSDGRLADSKQTTITITHVNRPPVLTELSDQTADENAELSFTISGSDPDNEDSGKLTYTAENLPTGSDFNTSTLTFSWTPTYEQSGLYSNVVFRLSDPAGLISEQAINLTVNHVNRPPQLGTVAAITINEQQIVEFTLEGSDPDQEDQEKLKYSISNLPEGATLTTGNGEFSWTPNFAQSGSYTLKVQVVDSAGLSAEIQIPLEVVNVNQPPVVEALPAQSGQENTAVSIQLKFSDPDLEDEGKLQVSTSSLPEGAQLDASSGLITWTPTYDQSGGYTIDYIITDSFGETVSGTVTLEIANVNRPPTLGTLENPQTSENQALSAPLPEGTDPDTEDQGQLVYTLENVPEGATFDATSRSLQWTPTYDQAGSYTCTYTVKDVGGLTAQSSLTITVTNVNRAPTLPPVTTIETEEGANLNQTLPEATDPDSEDAGNLIYEMGNLPGGANFNSSSRTLTWSPRYDQAGSYTMTYTVKDAVGETAQTSVTINVKNVNRPPTLNEIGSKSVKEGEELSFTVKGEDPDTEDQGKLTLSANNLPAGANFSGSSGNFSWIPRDDQQGNYQVNFRVEDSQGGNSQISVSITVEDVPPPPPPEENN
ncbi:MAG: tandem-95 repeat protein [Calditrichia bacterium]|nr:tandem-95 repeat protein [Calditrichia bacterium]